MNKFVKGTLGITIAGLFVLLATYGKPLAEAIEALWSLLLKASDDAPLGVASFALALTLATLSRGFLLKYMPAFRCFKSRDFVIDSAALLVGMAVTWLQMAAADPLARLNALWIGLIAGLAAPLVYNAFVALFALIGRTMRPAPPPKRSQDIGVQGYRGFPGRDSDPPPNPPEAKP